MGQDTSEFRDDTNPDPKSSFIKLSFKDFTLDMLPRIKASIKFSDAFKRREVVELEGTSIYFMSYFDLIEDKMTDPRRKDLEDVEQLKKLKDEDESLEDETKLVSVRK